MTRGPDDQPGHEAVVAFAVHLVSLVPKFALTEGDTAEIKRLWSRLSDFHRKKITFTQTELVTEAEDIARGMFHRRISSVTTGSTAVKRYCIV